MTRNTYGEFLDDYKQTPFDDVVRDIKKSPFFMTELGSEENTAVEALKALVYDGTPEEIATNFKTQGNDCFQERKFRDALEYYTQALEQHCGDSTLEIACLGNRAQCNIELKNYRRAVNDCLTIIEREPTNVKAWYRCAKCFYLVQRFDEALACCDSGLKLDGTNDALIKLKETIVNKKNKQIEIGQRRQRKLEQEKLRLQALRLAFDSRKFTRMRSATCNKNQQQEVFAELENETDPTSTLYLPVTVFYPLANQSDLLCRVSEYASVLDILQELFSQPPAWASLDYQVRNLQVFAPTRTGGLVKAGTSSTLKHILETQKPDVVMIDEMARFYVVPSQRASEWLSSWNKLEQAAAMKEP